MLASPPRYAFLAGRNRLFRRSAHFKATVKFLVWSSSQRIRLPALGDEPLRALRRLRYGRQSPDRLDYVIEEVNYLRSWAATVNASTRRVVKPSTVVALIGAGRFLPYDGALS